MMQTENIAALIRHVTEECERVDLEARYDEMLDECYSFKDVGGIFSNMSPSRVLKEVDPTAYRCGMNDWEDSEGLVEIGGDYYEQDKVDTARDGFVDNLESELSDLETELHHAEIDKIACAENEQLAADAKVRQLRDSVSDLERNIKEAEAYTF